MLALKYDENNVYIYFDLSEQYVKKHTLKNLNKSKNFKMKIN